MCCWGENGEVFTFVSCCCQIEELLCGSQSRLESVFLWLAALSQMDVPCLCPAQDLTEFDIHRNWSGW